MLCSKLTYSPATVLRRSLLLSVDAVEAIHTTA
jgi:hypothetical protein